MLLIRQKEVKDKPTMIIAKTVKGKGISFMEGESSWHGNAISDEHYEQSNERIKGVKMKALRDYYGEALVKYGSIHDDVVVFGCRF